MQGKRWRRQRKAVSPVLATVILIAITLIAAVAIAGFVFGLFGAFTSTAQVAVTGVSCSAGSKICTLVLTNSGTATVSTTQSGVITFGGRTETLTCGTTSVSPITPAITTVPAGGSQTIYCQFSSTATATAGQQFTGSVSLANGAQVQFSGTFGT